MLSASPALACENLPQSAANNYVDVHWDASSQTITVLGSGYNPSYEDYTPQPNDVVESEDYADYIFLDVADSGGGGGGGGGTPPNNPQSDPLLEHQLVESDQPGLLGCEPDPVEDRITVVGRQVAMNLNLPPATFRVIRRIFGGGGGGVGSSPQNPESTPGEADDCPGVPEMNKARASKQIRVAVGPTCTWQHRNRYFEVNFAGGNTGIYRGVGDCRFSINNIEIEAPDC